MASYLDETLSVDENVGGFEIPVNAVARVDVLHHLEQLQEGIEGG